MQKDTTKQGPQSIQGDSQNRDHNIYSDIHKTGNTIYTRRFIKQGTQSLQGDS